MFLGVPLPPYNPDVGYNCPMFLSNIDYYNFQSESDKAQVFGTCIPNPCFTIPMASDMPIGGFWLRHLNVQFPPERASLPNT